MVEKEGVGLVLSTEEERVGSELTNHAHIPPPPFPFSRKQTLPCNQLSLPLLSFLSYICGNLSKGEEENGKRSLVEMAGKGKEK